MCGARGRVAADLEGVVDPILAVSRLVVDMPMIKELDLNTVRVRAKGLMALDARIIKNVNI